MNLPPIIYDAQLDRAVIVLGDEPLPVVFSGVRLAGRNISSPQDVVMPANLVAGRFWEWSQLPATVRLFPREYRVGLPHLEPWMWAEQHRYFVTALTDVAKRAQFVGFDPSPCAVACFRMGKLDQYCQLFDRRIGQLCNGPSTPGATLQADLEKMILESDFCFEDRVTFPSEPGEISPRNPVQRVLPKL